MDLSDAIVAKEGGLYCVTLRDGSVPSGGGHPLGLYLDDCRHLSGIGWRIGGAAPRLLAASAPSGNAAVHELTNADLRIGDRALPAQSMRIRLDRRLEDPPRLRERLTVELSGGPPVTVDVELALEADFRAMLAIRGFVDLAPPAVTCAAIEGGVRLAAVTADHVERTTDVRCSPAPAATAGATLRFTLDLHPGAAQAIEVDYVPAPEAAAEVAGARAVADAEAATVQIDDELAGRVLWRSLDDLRALRTPLGDAAYFAAGVPWYVALFGRDSLIAATELLGYAPAMAEHTLRALAERIGQRTHPEREEEPGKILHELRVGEVAALGLSPLTRYYGTVDATPLFLCLLADHAGWTGDLAVFRALRKQVEAALRWLERAGDLLTYRAQAPGGLRNQGWKDSADGVVDERGVPLEPPIALVEPQGYAIAALRGVARLYEADGDAGAAESLRARADALAARLESFWLPERRCYAMAIDGAGRASGAVASNQGHLLWARAVSGERAGAIRDALMGDGLFSGWGIRTLARGEAAYNPLAYHLGSVWPHDTAMCAAGLRAYGYDADAAALLDALLDAASHVTEHRLPELFAGYDRVAGEPPVPYPVACRPQAWAAGAIPYLLLACLGLEADGPNRRLHVRRPTLPRGTRSLTLRGLAVAGARVDLRFERDAAGAVALAGAEVRGDLEVVAGP